jgi:hypothetical protein
MVSANPLGVYAMDERRSLERLKPYYYLRVYNVDTHRYVGSVVDISLKGMRLLSDMPFDSGKHYNFRMRLPEDSFFGKTVTVAAKSRWCKPTDAPQSFESGFEFPGDVGPGILTIKALLDDLKEKDAM